jgi:hypothetical protein
MITMVLASAVVAKAQVRRRHETFTHHSIVVEDQAAVLAEWLSGYTMG